MFACGFRAACWLLPAVMLFVGHVAAQEPKQGDLGGLSIEDLAKMKGGFGLQLLLQQQGQQTWRAGHKNS